MNDPTTREHTSVPDETMRRGALVLRTLPILLIPIVVAAITFVLIRISLGNQFVPPSPEQSPFGLLVPIVVLVVFFSALIILVRLGRPTISALIMIMVWMLLTIAAALQSSVSSYFPAIPTAMMPVIRSCRRSVRLYNKPCGAVMWLVATAARSL